MIILKCKEKCPFEKKCPNLVDEGSDNNLCQGLNSERNSIFICELAKEDGCIDNINFRMRA
jgi:ribosomal protein RSM22 (predicted rRNA methylase)